MDKRITGSKPIVFAQTGRLNNLVGSWQLLVILKGKGMSKSIRWILQNSR